MDSLPLSDLIVPELLLLLLALYLRSVINWKARTHGRPLPPGPRPLPLIGNLLDIPKHKVWIGFRDMSAQYGDVALVHVMGRPLVILGNADVVEQYLDKRSRITSDKLQSPLVELVGSDLNFGFYPYGERWRRHRRAFWQHFTPHAILQYRPVQLATAHKLLVHLHKDPSRLKDHIRFTLAETILKLLYDIDVADESDPYVALIDAAVEGAVQSLAPGKHLIIDFLPFLRHLPKWFPGAGFQKQFAIWRAAGEALKNIPFTHVKDGMGRGERMQCVVGRALESMNCSGMEGVTLEEEEDILKNVGAVAIEGGSDTTFSTIQTVFLAMSLYPDVLWKAQAELDAIVGPTRLPDFDDQPSLVYVNAIIKEALRWQNVIPLGVPHRLMEDDEFHGYFIPKGTLLLPNIWACMHDPREYQSPEEFCPERFVRDGKMDSTIRDPSKFVFGSGRRICPGRHFAEASLFINVASVLHVFDITPPLDDNGNPIVIKPRMSDGLLTYPEDARCTLKPRSVWAEALILARE